MSDKAKMQVMTTIPLVAIILGLLATGRTWQLVESNSEQTRNLIRQFEDLRERQAELRERQIRVEAFLGINPQSDGTKKP